MNEFQKRKKDFVNRIFTRSIIETSHVPCPICSQKKKKDIREVLAKVKKEFNTDKNTD